MYIWGMRSGVAMIAMMTAVQAVADAPHAARPAEPAVAVMVSDVTAPANWGMMILGFTALGFACRADVRKFARLTI